MKKNLCFFERDGLCFLVNAGTGIKPEMIEYFPDTNPVLINYFTNRSESLDFKGKICFSLS